MVDLLVNISVHSGILFSYGMFLQAVPSWDVSPTAIYGTLVAAMGSAIWTLWNNSKKKDEAHKAVIAEKDKEIRELNELIRQEIKEAREDG